MSTISHVDYTLRHLTTGYPVQGWGIYTDITLYTCMDVLYMYRNEIVSTTRWISSIGLAWRPDREIQIMWTPSTTMNFYYRSVEVTKVTKMTPKTRKSADQRNNLIPEIYWDDTPVTCDWSTV